MLPSLAAILLYPGLPFGHSGPLPRISTAIRLYFFSLSHSWHSRTHSPATPSHRIHLTKGSASAVFRFFSQPSFHFFLVFFALSAASCCLATARPNDLMPPRRKSPVRRTAHSRIACT